jgi:hypothetical protein
MSLTGKLQLLPVQQENLKGIHHLENLYVNGKVKVNLPFCVTK